MQGEATKAANAKGYVIVDLGKRKRRDVRELRKGGGKLLGEVEQSLAELRATGTVGESAQTVLVIVRQKPKRLRWF